ncbi:MAG: 50S ribosomal protein L35 [Candidatus Niyogibacteria bacterium]|nr:50S ribosomal protein L35 [Candidatus Niyogibacteria bacterium]
MTGLKTNKSFSKRLRVTKHGKLLARRPNQNHFRAKKSRKTELHTKRWDAFAFSSKKLQGHYLPYSN